MTNDLATRLRIEIALRDHRQGAIAQDAGITESTLSRILHGKQTPSDGLLTRIEDAIRAPARRG